MAGKSRGRPSPGFWKIRRRWSRSKEAFELGGGELVFSTLFFPPPQNQQLGISVEDFSDFLPEASAPIYAMPDFLHPVFGNPFHSLFSLHHIGQQPLRMTGAYEAAAGGLATLAKALGQRARQSLGRDG